MLVRSWALRSNRITLMSLTEMSCQTRSLSVDLRQTIYVLECELASIEMSLQLPGYLYFNESPTCQI
jgi:hypothetical protein